MSTITAHALIGESHSLHGGITSVTHTLFLNENSRPVLSLLGQDLPLTRQPAQPPIYWIPTVEHMLEDAMLMIYMFALRNQEVRSGAPSALRKRGEEPTALYPVTKQESIDHLYAKCREIHAGIKIQWVVSKESTLHGQLPALNEYDADIEVFTPTYCREYSSWDGTVRVDGSLPTLK